MPPSLRDRLRRRLVRRLALQPAVADRLAEMMAPRFRERLQLEHVTLAEVEAALREAVDVLVRVELLFAGEEEGEPRHPLLRFNVRDEPGPPSIRQGAGRGGGSADFA